MNKKQLELIKKTKIAIQKAFNRKAELEIELSECCDEITLSEKLLDELSGSYNPIKETLKYIKDIESINEDRPSREEIISKLLSEGKDKEAKQLARIFKIKIERKNEHD